MNTPDEKDHWKPWLLHDNKTREWAWGIQVGNGTVGSGMAATPEDGLRCLIQVVLSNPKRFTRPGEPPEQEES